MSDSAQQLAFTPARNDESWRLTDLSSLQQYDFQAATNVAEAFQLEDIATYILPDTVRLVFVNGFYAEHLSDLRESNISLSFLRMRESSSFDPFRINITNSMDKSTPIIHLLHIAVKNETPTANYPKADIVMEADSKAIVVEDYVGLNNRDFNVIASNTKQSRLDKKSLSQSPYFSNTVSQITLKQNASLEHVRLQREDKDSFHIGQCSVSLDKHSNYVTTSISLGAHLARYTANIKILGEGAVATQNGLTLIGSRQISDVHTCVEHAAPHAKSTQLHKCIIDGAAHAIFSGKIIVAKMACGTDSKQISRSLLLSDKARVDAQPELEIYNDAVSCSHGATVSQMDADTLFFLKSRGIDEINAKNLCINAFAAEIINKISVNLVILNLFQDSQFSC